MIKVPDVLKPAVNAAMPYAIIIGVLIAGAAVIEFLDKSGIGALLVVLFVVWIVLGFIGAGLGIRQD